MPLFRKSEKTAESAGADIDTYIGSGTRLVGDLLVEGSVRVDGRVEGDISGRDLVVIVGKTGVVAGNITAQHVFAAGKVTGDISASRGIEVFASAVLEGNFRYSRLTIEEGAVIQGNFSRLESGGEPGQPAGAEEGTAEEAAGEAPEKAART